MKKFMLKYIYSESMQYFQSKNCILSQTKMASKTPSKFKIRLISNIANIKVSVAQIFSSFSEYNTVNDDVDT